MLSCQIASPASIITFVVEIKLNIFIYTLNFSLEQTSNPASNLGHPKNIAMPQINSARRSPLTRIRAR